MRDVNRGAPVTVGELTGMADKMFGGLVKAVVDVKREVMLIDAEMHADEEAQLLRVGSGQPDLWGINLYPEFYGTDDFVEFDSVINIRPVQNNRTRGVENEDLRNKIVRIVGELVRP